MTARVIVLVVACGACRAHFDAIVDAGRDGGVADTPRDSLHDTGLDGTAATCPTFALFCDGFETGDTSRWTSTAISPGASQMVQTAITHSGTYALRGTVPAGGVDGDAASVVKMFAQQSTGMLAVREWIYEEQPLSHYDGVIIFEDATNPMPAVLVGGDASTLWDATETAATGSSTDHATTTTVAQSTWVCVELDYTFGSPSTIALYIDDSAILQVAAKDTAPAYGRLFAGAARAASTVGTDTILDDVVIAAQHIGCQ